VILLLFHFLHLNVIIFYLNHVVIVILVLVCLFVVFQHQYFAFYHPTNATKCYYMLCFWLLKNDIPSHFITLKVTRHSQENNK